MMVSSSFPWLLVIAGVPLVGALATWSVPAVREKLAKQVALAASLVTLGFVIAAGLAYEPGLSPQGADGMIFQFARSFNWIPQFGVHFSYGVDGIGLVMVALVAVLVPVVLLSSWHDIGQHHRSVATYYALVLILETMMIGVFVATDVFLFYVLFEAMLIPMYFLIGSYGGLRRRYAAVKFLIYSLVGGLLMLAALIGLYAVSAAQLPGGGTFDFATLTSQLNIGPNVQKALFLGFFVAFAIKAPLWPFHTWLPDAGAESSPGTAVLLVGIMDKVGTFGMIRYCLPLFPDASDYFAPLIIVLAVIGIFYGAFLAMGQRDLQRLVSYTSIAHFGFIALGIFVFTSQGQTGSVFYMVNHGFSTGALFLVVGFLVARRGTRDADDYGGVGRAAPILAGVFLFAGMSSLALPGLSTFVSEFLVLVGTYTVNKPAAIIAAVGIVFAALYILLMFQRTMQGPITKANEGMRDLTAREAWVVAPVLTLLLVLGIFPKPVLDVITPAVDRTLSVVHKADPPPTDARAADAQTPAAPSGASK